MNMPRVSSSKPGILQLFFPVTCEPLHLRSARLQIEQNSRHRGLTYCGRYLKLLCLACLVSSDMSTLFYLQVLTMWSVHVPLRHTFYCIQTKTDWVDSSVMTSEVHL